LSVVVELVTIAVMVIAADDDFEEGVVVVG
jgi:hypothetical protein